MSLRCKIRSICSPDARSGAQSMVSCLTLDEMVSLDSAMLHHECRRELMDVTRHSGVWVQVHVSAASDPTR